MKYRRRQYKFVCAVSGGQFLVRKPKMGYWPDFSENINAALKFSSEKEAKKWLAINGNPRVWLEHHTCVL